MKNEQQISNVPTNIVTGFLGSGKTSAILNLLKSKPDDERWAVLVNEFGEIGVDGSLFKGQHREDHGVFITEVPGGCMCCAAGLPMQIALNMLLARSRPDRLLIEPTGLGHPVEVLGILSGEYYRDSLSIEKIVTLVDARNLADNRYTEHNIFNQQIAIADVIVGNKADLYQDHDYDALSLYAADKGPDHAQVLTTEQGVFDLSLLHGPTQAREAREARPHHHHTRRQEALVTEQPLPESGFLSVENRGEGFKSVGWRFAPHLEFDHDKLVSFLSGLEAERMKAVFITKSGIYGYNLTPDAMTEVPLDECIESRVEIIAPELNPAWEQQLKDCLV